MYRLAFPYFVTSTNKDCRNLLRRRFFLGTISVITMLDYVSTSVVTSLLLALSLWSPELITVAVSSLLLALSLWSPEIITVAVLRRNFDSVIRGVVFKYRMISFFCLIFEIYQTYIHIVTRGYSQMKTFHFAFCVLPPENENENKNLETKMKSAFGKRKFRFILWDFFKFLFIYLFFLIYTVKKKVF
jgi:hypothetical protein